MKEIKVIATNLPFIIGYAMTINFYLLEICPRGKNKVTIINILVVMIKFIFYAIIVLVLK